MMELHADPLGTYPDPLPLGAPVHLTGQFDHPAASACTQTHFFVNAAPSVYCRTIFAVTTIASP